MKGSLRVKRSKAHKGMAAKGRFKASAAMQGVADAMRAMAGRVERGEYPTPAALSAALDDQREELFLVDEAQWGLVKR